MGLVGTAVAEAEMTGEADACKEARAVAGGADRQALPAAAPARLFCSLLRLFALFFLSVELAGASVSGPSRNLARGTAVRHEPAARTRLECHAFLGLAAALAAQNYFRLMTMTMTWLDLLALLRFVREEGNSANFLLSSPVN